MCGTEGTHPERNVEDVRDPHRADRELVLGRDPDRVAVLLRLDAGRVVDLHDRVARAVDGREVGGGGVGGALEVDGAVRRIAGVPEIPTIEEAVSLL